MPVPTAKLNVTDLNFYADPRDAVEWIHKESPVYFLEGSAAYGRPLWLIATWEDVRAVKADADLFTTRYGTHLEEAALIAPGDPDRPASPAEPDIQNYLTTMTYRDPPEHRRIRKVLSPSFSRRHVEEYWAKVAVDTTQRLLDDVEVGSTVDFVPLTSGLAVGITCALLGVDLSRSDDYMQWAAAVMDTLEPDATADWDAINAMLDFVREQLEQRYQQRGDDLISDLIERGINTGELDRAEVVVAFWEMLSGGIETSTQLQAGGLAALLDHPDQMAEMAADRSLIPRAVEEMLRWVTPIRYNTRVATQDTTLHGAKISKGDLVMTNYFFANRDPSAFEDPWRFDIKRPRSKYENLSFGYGPHHCIGAHIARVQAQAFFDGVLDRGWHLELAEKPVVKPSTLVSGYERLAIVVS